jgi:CrcB protein
MKPIVEFSLIAMGGALGAMTRYAIHLWADQTFKENALVSSLPVGTFIANVAGCFLIGLLIGSGRSELSRHLRLFAGIGFLGALTTFSTFGTETVKSLEEGSWAIATCNVLANVCFGLAAVMFGLWLGRKMVSP